MNRCERCDRTSDILNEVTDGLCDKCRERGGVAISQRPLPPREALKAALRQKATVMRMWYTGDGKYDQQRDAVVVRDGFVDAAFVIRHMKRLDEMSARVLRRWKAIRLVWERDGFSGPPPWQVIESMGKHEVRT